MELIFTEKARKITLALTIAAVLICCGILNTAGGYALLQYPKYAKCGQMLYISSVLLALAAVISLFKKWLIPTFLNIFGTAAYVYTLAKISSIPNEVVSSADVSKILMHHYPTIAVTVLLAALAVFTFFCPDAVNKRKLARDAKIAERERKLKDNERIV